MINSSVIISGEASETDSDDETRPKFTRKTIDSSIQGEMITGEDSESDDENDSISSAASVLTQPEPAADKPELHPETKNNSLLHRKLRECNKQLYSDLEAFCQTITTQAGKSLTIVDQQLLKSQITLQTAVPSLRTLNINSALLKEKLQSTLCSNFISNIKL